MAQSKTSSNAVSFRDEVLKLINEVDKSYFRLGEKLSTVAREGMFKGWGFDTFEEYVESELGFARRKAYYLIQIFERATQLGIPEATLERIGWTKAKEILIYDAIDTLTAFDEWAGRAMSMSVSELQSAIKSAILGKPVPKKGRDADGNRTVTIDGELFHELKAYLTDDQYGNVKLALQKAQGMAQSPKIGHLLDLICLDFLANNTTLTSLNDKLANWAQRGFIEIEEAGTATEPDPSTLMSV